MGLDTHTYHEYVTILEKELVPALGCTEPIAIAYASAVAKKTLGCIPEKIIAACSGNIIKNVKSVIVPNSGGLKGIEAAATIGAIGGNPDKKLEVLTDVTEEDIKRTRELLKTDYCSVEVLNGVANLHIIITATAGEEKAVVEIIDTHTNIVRIEKNDQVIFKSSEKNSKNEYQQIDWDCLNIEDILEFANTVRLEDVKEILDRQINYNTTISNEGLTHQYGANIGKTLLDEYGNSIRVRAKAKAAAGSDARMSGCVLPVVINSGSGNQGMTVSLPVIEYAKELEVGSEKLYRALVVSNLIAIYLKSGIGRLSAYCGAVSAACGSGAAITYLYGGDYDHICKTITNTLANISGIVCDGAKPSCAAKIATSVDAAIMAHYLSMGDNAFTSGEGIVKDDVEKTIDSVGRLARDGMKETDVEVLKIMVGK
jgi:Uncharacterized conserved protein